MPKLDRGKQHERVSLHTLIEDLWLRAVRLFLSYNGNHLINLSVYFFKEMPKKMRL